MWPWRGVLRDGASEPLDTFTLDGDDRSFGSAITLDLRRVTGLRLRDATGTSYTAIADGADRDAPPRPVSGSGRGDGARAELLAGREVGRLARRVAQCARVMWALAAVA